MNNFIGTATAISTENGRTNIKYHRTIVVSFTDNDIILDSGGWYTNTTKSRMNQTSACFELGYSVNQKQKDVWYVKYNNKTIKFQNNMVLKRHKRTVLDDAIKETELLDPRVRALIEQMAGK